MASEQTEAKELVAAITKLKERAEAAAREAEVFRSKADSESGFAYNAKQNAEDHAKAISQVKGTVDADFAGLTTTKKNAEETSQAITAAKIASEADSRIVSEARATIEKVSAGLGTAISALSSTQSAIEKTKTDVAVAFNEVTTNTAAVAAAKATVDAAMAAAQALQGQINEIASKCNVDGATTAKVEGQSRVFLDSISEVVTLAKSTYEHVTQYEKKLASLTESFDILHGKIEGLLPNATSAGLASAFRNQKKRLIVSQRVWIGAFVVTIVLLIYFGASGLTGILSATTAGTSDSWDQILRHLASRLPLVAPLVWLAIYAGRHYTLALRVEEEYSFKEAVSTSFEGYKKELAGISGEAHSPIVTFCENVLHTLALRPGRIYEGKQEDLTLLTPINNLAEKIIAAIGARINPTSGTPPVPPP